MRSSGFTLIELIIVIVLLGILSAVAAPRFLDLSDEARAATFRATASAFREGVKLVHLTWRVRGNGRAQQDFIPISDPIANGDLSVNEFGYPADTRGTSLTMNSANDCIDVWHAVLDTSDYDAAVNDSADIEASYNGNFGCTYFLVEDPGLTVNYDSTTGAVTINI